MALARAAKHKEQKLKKAQAEEESKVKLVITHPGDAVNFPQPGDSVSIHYTGHLPDGTEFDNSYNRGKDYAKVLI